MRNFPENLMNLYLRKRKSQNIYHQPTVPGDSLLFRNTETVCHTDRLIDVFYSVQQVPFLVLVKDMNVLAKSLISA